MKPVNIVPPKSLVYDTDEVKFTKRGKLLLVHSGGATNPQLDFVLVRVEFNEKYSYRSIYTPKRVIKGPFLEVHLQPKPRKMLGIISYKPKRIWPYEQLLEKIYGKRQFESERKPKFNRGAEQLSKLRCGLRKYGVEVPIATLYDKGLVFL